MQMVPDLNVNLCHLCCLSSLRILFKIFENPGHPLHAKLPKLAHPVKVCGCALSLNGLFFLF